MRILVDLSDAEAANLIAAVEANDKGSSLGPYPSQVRLAVREKVRAAVALTTTPSLEVEVLKDAVIAASPFTDMSAREIADFLHRNGARA